MSARDIIQAIKELPMSELRAVKECVDERTQKSVRIADYDKAMQVAEEVMDENDELFRKLAQ